MYSIRFRSQHGYTLVELMVTLAVVVILLLVAVPNFTDLLRKNRLSSASNNLIAAVSLARSEAIKTNNPAIICASANGTTCSGDATGWGRGWIVWADADNDGVPDANEVVRSQGDLGGLSLASATASRITVNARGQVTAVASFAMQPTSCKPGVGNRREFSVLLSGMVRAEHKNCL